MTPIRFKIVAVLLAGIVSACAKSPDSIAPAYVSEVIYQDWSCEQLAEEASRLSAALTAASTQQENARTNDIVGVILIGLPVSSLSGDNIAPQIARLKGEEEAVRKASAKKNCGRPTITASPTETSPAEQLPAPTSAQDLVSAAAASVSTAEASQALAADACGGRIQACEACATGAKFGPHMCYQGRWVSVDSACKYGSLDDCRADFRDLP